jgi:hypothetical protein
MLRPGNAGANDADHHLELLDRSLTGLPEEYQVGHYAGDHPDWVTHPVVVRADSAGATHRFIDGLVEVNCDFSVGFPIDGRVRDALLLVEEEDWRQATETDGSVRGGPG